MFNVKNETENTQCQKIKRSIKTLTYFVVSHSKIPLTPLIVLFDINLHVS